MLLKTSILSMLFSATLLLNGTSVAADTNAKLFSLKAARSGNAPSITSIGAYKDWSKSYHEVVALTSNQVGFYRRTDVFFRVIAFTKTGAFNTVISTNIGSGYDDIIVDEFVGSGSRPDILMFKRKSREIAIYEYNPTTPKVTLVNEQTLDATKNGGSFDIVSSGYLGHYNGKRDILFYNKTEGSARIYRMSNDTLVKQKSFGGMQRNWDAIIPAKIDDNVFTDFAFYNQDGGGVIGTEDLINATNPLNGTVKMMSLGNDYTWKVLGEYHDSWPMHANVRIVPGQFGGDDRTDFLVYEGDPDGTSTATYWINKNGVYSALPSVKNWQGRWTNIVSLSLQNGLSDLFFYTRQVEVPIVLVVDNDGGGRGGVTQPKDEIMSDFIAILPLVNRAFAPAGVHFSVNPNMLNFDMDNVSGVNTTPEGGKCYNPATIAKEKLEAFAAYVRSSAFPNHLVSYVKRGTGSKSCGSKTTTFFVMAQPKNTKTTAFSRDGTSTPLKLNAKLFAHELGHTFSLGHSQSDTYFSGSAANDRYVFSSDDTYVWDTPPIPHTTKMGPNGEPSPWTALTNRCDDSGNNDISIIGQSYTLNPERHEIMSRGLNCDMVYRVTPDQASAIHTNRLKRDWVNQK